MNRLFKLILVVSIVLLMAGRLIACASPNESEKAMKSPLETDVLETQETTEPQKTTQGELSLEECEGRGGVFIAYDDGSFDEFPGGGYCLGLSRLTVGFSGMFLENSVLEKTPTITGDMKIIVFSTADYYHVNAYPIHHEVAAIQYTSDDGTKGYGKLAYEQDKIYVYYRNHESEDVKIEFINGEPSEEYDAVKIDREVYPSKGMKKVARGYRLAGFQKDEEVRLGVVKGTAIEEKSYEANITYFDCDNEHNNWDEEDQYYLDATPTVEGYAVIDFEQLPTGRYVLVYDYISGESMYYRAFLLDWNNE